MKKILALTLALLMMLGVCATLAACNGGKNPSESTTESTTVNTEPGTTEAPTTKPTEKETTEAPTEPVTTEAPTTETTEAPATETTETPATETTEAPATETTEAPTTETTEAPAKETTEAPATETTEAVAGETTEPVAGETTEAVAGETTEPVAGETTEPVAGETTESDTETDTKAPDKDDPTTPPEGDGQGDYPVDEDEETEGVIKDDDNASCHPRYAWDHLDHWSPACNITTIHPKPKEAGARTPHTFYCTIENEGDVLVYTYACKRCEAVIDRVEVPYDVSLYLDPQILLESEHDFGDNDNDFIMADGTENDPIIGIKFTSETGMGTKLVAFYDETTTTPTGRYLVMKVKLNDGRNQIGIGVASIDGWKSAKTVGGMATATLAGLSSGWSTVIVDLTKIVAPLDDRTIGYIPAADGQYYLNNLTIYMDGVSALYKDEAFQIAYIGFCDTLESAREFAKGEKVKYIFDDPMASSTPSSIDGIPCVHVYNKVGTDKHHSDFCDVCMDVGGTVPHKFSFIATRDEAGNLIKYHLECICGEKTKEISAPQGVNVFTPPTTINMDISWHGITNKNPYVDGNTLYQRIEVIGDKLSGQGATVPFTANGTLTFSDTQGGSGKFLIFKIRTHDVSTLSLKLASLTQEQVDTMTDKEKQTYIPDGYPNAKAWPYDDQWVTVVVDMEIVAASGKTNFVANSLDAVKVFAGVQVQDNEHEKNVNQEPTYIDIAYAAICDNWQEVAAVSDSDAVLFTPWVLNAPFIEATSDGQLECPAHNGKGTLSDDGKTVTYKCMICSANLGTVNVPEVSADNLNYLSLPGQAIMNYNAGVSVSGENGVPYTHVSFGISGQVRLHNTFGATGKMKDVDDTIVGGPGRFAVMKVRFGGVGIGQFKIGLYDGDTALSTEKPFTAANPNTDVLFESGGFNYRGVTQEMVDGGWTIYVVELSALNQTYYDVTDEATDKISVGIKIENGKGGKADDYIDIAYFAIADDWSEVATLLEGETLNFEYAPQWNDPTKDATRTHDNQCIDHALTTFDEDVTTMNGQNADVCYTCMRSIRCENPNCTEYNSAQAVFTSVAHSTKVTMGDPIYKNGADNDVCYTTVETTSCKNCSYSTESVAEFGHKMSLTGFASEGTNVKYSYKCNDDKCSNEQNITVSAENVNFYSAPGQLVNNWATGAIGGANNQANKVNTGAVIAENGEIFTRVKLYQGGTLILSNGTGTLEQGIASADNVITGGTGKYAVLKIRTYDVDFMSFGAYDNQKALGVNSLGSPDTDAILRGNSRTDLSTGADEDGWIVYVIDLELFGSSWYTAGADVENVVFALQGESTATKLSGNEYVDVAYFAVCDSWSEIGQIAGNDVSVTYTGWKNTANDAAKLVSDGIAEEAEAENGSEADTQAAEQ